MNTGKAEFPSAWKGPLAANVPEKGKAHIIDPAGRMAPIVVPYFAEDEPAPDGSRVLVAARADKSDEGIVAKIAYHAILSSDAAARKAIPLYSGFVNYFPDAMVAVAELSRIGNDQHNPGKALHWDRSKSGDELDALMRHLVEAGTTDTDGVRHSTKLAWRAMANLQKEIEASR